MRTVAEYRQFAADCRKLAAKLTDPRDKRATELMAGAWDKVADEREASLRQGPNGFKHPLGYVQPSK
jgi:hypothetical protein